MRGEQDFADDAIRGPGYMPVDGSQHAVQPGATLGRNSVVGRRRLAACRRPETSHAFETVRCAAIKQNDGRERRRRRWLDEQDLKSLVGKENAGASVREYRGQLDVADLCVCGRNERW